MQIEVESTATPGRATSYAFAIAFLIALPVLLFREQLFGNMIWIGSPDRLNSNLKILSFFAHGLASGNLSAWNEHEMMGYDSFALPYTFPSPFAWLAAGQGAGLIDGAGMLVPFLLAAGGISCFLLFRSIGVGSLAGTAGATLYEITALPVLKVSQNDLSYMVIVVVPLLLLCVFRSDRWRPIWFLTLSALLGLMLHGMFLQKAAYALMLLGAYAIWRTMTLRRLTPLVVAAVALICGGLFAAPRIFGIFSALKEYARVTPGVDLSNFEALYNFQNIHSNEILRWLDGTIFGISSSDAVRLGNNVNLTEGFLLSNSVIVPALLLLGLWHYGGKTIYLWRSKGHDGAFWFWALLATLSVIVLKDALHMLFLLFQRLDFTHARILVVGLLPMSALVALILHDRQPVPLSSSGGMLRTIAIGIACAAIAIGAMEMMLTYVPDTSVIEYKSLHLRLDAVLRVLFSLALFVLWIVLKSLSNAISRRGQILYVGLIAFLLGQSFLAAELQVNGPQTRHAVTPFFKGDMYYADGAAFRLPDKSQIDDLHQRLGNERQRTALVCEPDSAGGFCAGHVPEFWRLRAIDGYYGLGVPKRLIALPWNAAAGLRSISFTAAKDLPWPLLGFLNVGNALIVSPDLYHNVDADGRPADPAKALLLPNPEPVTPRVFFAAAAEPVADHTASAKQIFSRGNPRDVTVLSFVEGLEQPMTFDGLGVPRLTGQGDRIEVSFPPSSRQRLLVLNELPFPGWRARVDGIASPIFPSNVVMRGVLVPPGAQQVTFEYKSASQTDWACALRGGAIALALLIAALGGRWSGLRRSAA